MKLWILIFLMIIAPSCIHGINVWDERPILIKYLNLDDKLEEHGSDINSWERDLNFRHARLGLINEEVSRDQPDILTLLGVQVKSGSISESDLAVLATGSLGDYSWLAAESDKRSGDAKKKLSATAVALPLSIDQAKTLSSKQKWNIGDDGFAIATLIINGDSPLVLLNVQMPSRADQLPSAYSRLAQIVLQVTGEYDVCIARVVLVGYLPQDLVSQSDRDFLKRLRFVDSASGFCERTQNCATFSQENELGYSVYGNALGSRDERFFLHSSAVIYRANPAFSRGSGSVGKNFPEYGFEAVHASSRFGWEANVALKQCK